MSVGDTTGGIDQIQFDRVRALVLKDTPTGKTTLVDTDLDEDDEELVEILEQEYGGVNRIIIAHDDHGRHGGLPSVMETFDPELVASASESKPHGAVDYEPDVMFTGDDLFDGNIYVIKVPGHTKVTSASLLEDRGILVFGDTLGGVDCMGLPAGYLPPLPTSFNDDHKAAEINLYDLFQYDFKMLLALHGSHVLEDPKGKLDNFLIEYERDPRPE